VLPSPAFVHFLQIRICVQHGLLRFHAAVFHKRRRNAKPLVSVQSADFHFAVCGNLFGDVLFLPGLKIQFPLKEVRRTERTHPRLVPVFRRDKIGAAFFQKIVNFLHE
jgi:hypothetical protein